MDHVPNMFQAMDKLDVSIVIYKIVSGEKSQKPIDYIFIYGNQSYYNLTGFKKEEVWNKSFKTIFPADFGDEWITYYNQVVITNKENVVEKYVKQFNKYFKVKIMLVENDYLLIEIWDVTGLNIANQVVKKYQVVSNSSPEIILTLDQNGRIVDCNERAVIEYGYSKEEFQKLHIFDIRKQRKIKYLRKETDQVNHNEIKYQALHYRKDGTSFPAEVRMIEVDISGTKYMFNIIKNMTDIIKREQRLMELGAVIESSHNAIITITNEGIITSWNSAACKMFQYTKKEAMGKHISLILQNNGNRFFQISKNLVRQDKKDQILLTKSGIELNVSINMSPIKNEENDVIGMALIVYDMTEKKKLLESLDNNNKMLKETLQKLESAQVQLIQDEKMASIGQLSAGIAHEINNPLGYIMSNFDTLKKYIEKFKDAIIEYKNALSKSENDIEVSEAIYNKYNLNFILEDLNDLYRDTGDGLDRVKKIVKALRSFSYVDFNNNFDNYDINEGIKNTLTIANNELKYTTEVILDLAEIPIIQANGSEINQVILNIIINSSHAIKDNLSEGNIATGMVHITTYQDKDYVYCEVEDNGIGIPENLLNKVFDPFFTTKPVGKGTGLGLSITYDIIKNKHKGKIELESKQKKGTRIKIGLPINTGEQSMEVNL